VLAEAQRMRVVKYRHGKHWGIVEDATIEINGSKYYRQKFLINLPGVSQEDAEALLTDLQEGRAEIRRDRVGHKYIGEIRHAS